MQICDLNINLYKKNQFVKKTCVQKHVVQITMMQEYCVHRAQVKYKMTEKTNNANPIV